MHRRIATTLAALALLAACAASGPLVLEVLDPVTGVTVTRTAATLTLFRDNSAHAAYARDYVSLAPLGVNRMGRHRYYLWLGIWSTLPDTQPAARRDGFESVVLFADGEPLALDIAGWSPDAVGLSDGAYPRPVASAAEAYYEVTLDQIRVLAEARGIRLAVTPGGAGDYEPWDEDTAAHRGLEAFVERAGY